MHRVVNVAVFVAAILVAPAVAFGQATIAGVVRDASAAVLPGVTVEASSSMLIEKTRTVVSDGTGQYRVTDLPPGAVAVRHFHPGDEAIYMLQGALRFEPEGGQPFELKAGQVSFNPAKHIHEAKNNSTSVPAKILNCMIAEKGQPLAIAQ